MPARAPVVLVIAVALASGGVFATRPARASSEEEQAAGALYRKAKALYDKGEFSGAAEGFERSLLVKDTPQTRVYLAATLASLKRCDRVAALLQPLVVGSLPANARVLVEAARSMCRPEAPQAARAADPAPSRLSVESDPVGARVEMTGPSSFGSGGKVSATLPSAPLELPPGTYQMKVTLPPPAPRPGKVQAPGWLDLDGPGAGREVQVSCIGGTRGTVRVPASLAVPAGRCTVTGDGVQVAADILEDRRSRIDVPRARTRRWSIEFRGMFGSSVTPMAQAPDDRQNQLGLADHSSDLIPVASGGLTVAGYPIPWVAVVLGIDYLQFLRSGLHQGQAQSFLTATVGVRGQFLNLERFQAFVELSTGYGLTVRWIDAFNLTEHGSHLAISARLGLEYRFIPALGLTTSLWYLAPNVLKRNEWQYRFPVTDSHFNVVAMSLGLTVHF